MILSWINEICAGDFEKRALLVAMGNDFAYVVQAIVRFYTYHPQKTPSTYLHRLSILSSAIQEGKNKKGVDGWLIQNRLLISFGKRQLSQLPPRDSPGLSFSPHCSVSHQSRTPCSLGPAKEGKTTLSQGGNYQNLVNDLVVWTTIILLFLRRDRLRDLRDNSSPRLDSPEIGSADSDQELGDDKDVSPDSSSRDLENLRNVKTLV